MTTHKHRIIEASIAVKNRMLKEDDLLHKIDQVAVAVCNVYRSGNKVMLCGNGGSAADAQHIAAELGGRFQRERDPLPALALHTNSSFLTAVANDYSYEEIFSRAVEAHGQADDILIGISTSGSSANVLNALKTARGNRISTVGMTGRDAGKMQEHCDYLLPIPSEETPRIQEAHILVGHMICQQVEDELFPAQKND